MSGNNSDLKSALVGDFAYLVKMHGENNIKLTELLIGRLHCSHCFK
jgi:hypothetical protein